MGLACDNIDTQLYPEIGVDFSSIPNLSELEFQAICFSKTWWPHDDETETDMVTGLAEFLATFSTEHKVKKIDVLFDCYMDVRDKIIPNQRPQDIEAHLRTGNWGAFDSAIVRIASAAKHLLELSIVIEYFVGRDESMTLAAVEKAREKDKGTLEGWGEKFLPRASGSPNVVMKVFTQYGDSCQGIPRCSGVVPKPAIPVGE